MSYRNSFSQGRGSQHYPHYESGRYESGRYGSGGYGSGRYGSDGYESDDYGSDSSESSRSSCESSESDGYVDQRVNVRPAHTNVVHHYHYSTPSNRDTSAIERADYQQDRGDYYEAAYNQAHQRAELYHADRDEYGQRYYNERYQHRLDNQFNREAQRYQYYQGYQHGYEDAYEDGEQALRNQRWQHPRAGSEDDRHYAQDVREASVQSHTHGEQQRTRQPRENPQRRGTPSNRTRRVRFEDDRGNDPAFRDRSRWHGYAETEPDDEVR